MTERQTGGKDCVPDKLQQKSLIDHCSLYDQKVSRKDAKLI